MTESDEISLHSTRQSESRGTATIILMCVYADHHHILQLLR